MAWVLKFDGVNDYAQITTPIMLSGDFDLEVKFKVYAGAGSTSVVLSTQSDGAQWIGRWSTTRHLAFWNGQINFVEGFQVDTDYTYRLVRTGSSVDWYINGVLESTFTNGTVLTIPAFGKLGGASNNLFGQIEYMTITGLSNYDATNSSHAPGTPVLTDFVSGNNATGVNMPTDGSAWEDLGGGGLLITPAGIPSQESFGSPLVELSDKVLVPTGITSQEVVESPIVLNNMILNPTSINSEEMFGVAAVQSGGVVLLPVGIASAAIVGTPALSYPQLVIVNAGIASQEMFGIAIIQDGVELVIPVKDRATYQAIQAFLASTGKFLSKQNNDIIVEWLRSEGMTKETFNGMFSEYWEQKGFTGAYNDKWRKWKDE